MDAKEQRLIEAVERARTRLKKAKGLGTVARMAAIRQLSKAQRNLNSYRRKKRGG